MARWPLIPIFNPKFDYSYPSFNSLNRHYDTSDTSSPKSPNSHCTSGQKCDPEGTERTDNRRNCAHGVSQVPHPAGGVGPKPVLVCVSLDADNRYTYYRGIALTSLKCFLFLRTRTLAAFFARRLVLGFAECTPSSVCFLCPFVGSAILHNARPPPCARPPIGFEDEFACVVLTTVIQMADLSDKGAPTEAIEIYSPNIIRDVRVSLLCGRKTTW